MLNEKQGLIYYLKYSFLLFFCSPMLAIPIINVFWFKLVLEEEIKKASNKPNTHLEVKRR